MSKHYVAVDAPTIHHSRSRFDLSYNVKTSMNVGTLYPIYLQEIYPGDTFNCDTSLVTRLSSSFLRPVMGNLMLDVYYFFVPNRIVFPDWEDIFGGDSPNGWTQPVTVEAPHTADNFKSVIYPGSVGDYLGLPISTIDPVDQSVDPDTYIPGGLNVLPFRAFAKVYDDWFRDENLIAPMYIQTGQWTINETPNNQAWAPGNYMGKLPKVSKFHDIFTSALPGTQKGSAIQVPLSGTAPVIGGTLHSTIKPYVFLDDAQTVGNSAPLLISRITADGSMGRLGVGANTSTSISSNHYVDSSNLVADLAQAGLVNVTDIRYAFQLQRILERTARTGSRFTEYLLAAFGVSSPDARLQRAEYLGGKRMPLSVQQVAQSTRGEDGSTQLGSLGAFSLSNGRCGYQKGFVEHGFVIGVACIRQYHDYSQGIARMWQRHARFDYYDPALANISEVPVYKSELFGLSNYQSSDTLTSSVFGYQEAWYDLRARTNLVTGNMRPASPTPFDIWHFADYYQNAPTLNQQFINETPDFVDRTIAVPSSSADQFIVDIYHKQTAIRVLPTYSIPGLIDHH